MHTIRGRERTPLKLNPHHVDADPIYKDHAVGAWGGLHLMVAAPATSQPNGVINVYRINKYWVAFWNFSGVNISAHWISPWSFVDTKKSYKTIRNITVCLQNEGMGAGRRTIY